MIPSKWVQICELRIFEFISCVPSPSCIVISLLSLYKYWFVPDFCCLKSLSVWPYALLELAISLIGRAHYFIIVDIIFLLFLCSGLFLFFSGERKLAGAGQFIYQTWLLIFWYICVGSVLKAMFHYVMAMDWFAW